MFSAYLRNEIATIAVVNKACHFTINLGLLYPTYRLVTVKIASSLNNIAKNCGKMNQYGF